MGASGTRVRLVIRDGTEPGGRGYLDFDLLEVLAALGDRALESRWLAHDLEYISKDELDVPIIEAMARGQAVSGQELASGIEALLQVIDGEFLATAPGDEHPWIVVKAFDSTRWEVVSADAKAHEAIRNAFRVVEQREPDAAQ